MPRLKMLRELIQRVAETFTPTTRCPATLPLLDRPKEQKRPEDPARGLRQTTIRLKIFRFQLQNFHNGFQKWNGCANHLESVLKTKIKIYEFSEYVLLLLLSHRD